MTSVQQEQQHQQQHNDAVGNGNSKSITTTEGGAGSNSTATAPLYDPELSPIPGQEAWVIVDLYGTIVRSSASALASASAGSPSILQDVQTLYTMLVEATPLVGPEDHGLTRMTINFDRTPTADADAGAKIDATTMLLRYVISRDDNHIYMIQQQIMKPKK